MWMGLTGSGQGSYFAITEQAGISLPLGDYRLKSLSGGSFTLPGMTTTLEGAWYFLPPLGVGIYAGFHSHPVDVRSLGYEKVVDDPFLDDVTIRSDPYRVFNLLGGAFIDWKIYRGLSVTGKLMGGATYAKTPYQLYKAKYYLVGNKWFDITSAGDYEATFLIGTGLKYYWNDFLGVSLQSDFTYNAMEFDFMQSDGNLRTEYRKILFINIAAGVIFVF